VVLVSDECRVEKESGIMGIWYPRGKQPSIAVEQQKEAVSFYGALNVATGKESILKAPRQTSAYTVRFLRKLEKEHQGKKVLLIWDGAPWHRGKVKDYLKEKGKKCWIEIMYFPAYSPDLNPQEHVWKLSRQTCTHNSENPFEVKVEKFHRFLKRKRFVTNFLKKYM